MNGNLYPPLDYEGDPLWPIKEYFNAMQGSNFAACIGHILDRVSCSNSYVACEFPENEEDDFDGIRIRVISDEFLFTDEQLAGEMKRACDLYSKRYPDERQPLADVLAKPKPG